MFENLNAFEHFGVKRRTKCLVSLELVMLHRWTDQLFVVLLLLQWTAGIAMALAFSSAMLIERVLEAPIYIWTVASLGAGLTLFVSCLVLLRGGTVQTRYIIAVNQMLCSVLLIHLSGGSVESHFHVYGSLAVLAFYRDWQVLAVATTTVIAGQSWLLSEHEIAASVLWRSRELLYWVAVEVAFLLIAIRQSTKQSWATATTQAHRDQQHWAELDAKNSELKHVNKLLEATNQYLERQMVERSEANCALRASEDRYRRIVDLSPLACLVVKEGLITFVNPPCVTLLKAHFADDLVGRPLLAIIHPSHHELFINCLRPVEQQDNVISSSEATLRCLEGTLKEVEVSAFSFVEDEGIGFQVFLRDISERIWLEAQNRQAQKMEVTGQLAGGIAHDFNNLLAVILGCCHFLEMDKKLNDDSRELVADVYKAGNRAATLTRQLLAHSRQQVLRSTVLNLNEVVIETGNMLERVIGEDIVLTCNAFPDLWSICVDAGQIQQVIMNLAVNARDAMPQGGRLTIETSNCELVESYAHKFSDLTPGPYVALSVSDTGCGMDKSTIVRMFEPFFTTKEVGKGTGLGLATVFGIVKQSGGHVTVSSELGHGSTFNVYLPKAEGELVQCTKGPTPTPRRGMETVLVVEDETAVRNLACRILRSLGYNVLAATNGEEALRAFHDYDGLIELVLTDVVMPEMGGVRLHDRLLEIQPNLSVLYMSGYMDDVVVRHGVLETETNFVEKPFSYIALANAVRKVLDGRARKPDLLRAAAMVNDLSFADVST